MKHTRLVLLLILSSGCLQKTTNVLTIDGNTPCFKTGVCIVTNDQNVDAYGENINDFRFHLKIPSVKPGYYTVKLRNADRSDSIKPCQVYLENGEYTIETDAKRLYRYPKIKSPSKLQNQLSAFYTLSDNLKDNIEAEIDSLDRILKTQSTTLSSIQYNGLLNKLSLAELKLRTADANIFKEFLKRYPQNNISIVLMDNLHYAGDPLNFYPIFKTLPLTIRSSERGKVIDSILSHLVKLMPGIKAPVISGKMPDGKSFNPAYIAERLILIEFWQANNKTDLTKHLDLIKQLKGEKNFALLSVALAVDPGVWATAIENDKLAPFKILDINGDGTKDSEDWMMPYTGYYLLDSNWKILKDDLYVNDIPRDISNALKKHN